MTLEGDAVHLPALTLVPVGAAVHRDPTVDRQIIVGDISLQRDTEAVDDVVDSGEHLEPGVATGNALLDGHVDLGGLVVTEAEIDLGVHVAAEG